jgi:hypothetical protein
MARVTTVDGAVLWAIARAIEQGGEVDVALAALRGLDPLLRGSARRRLREAHADAQLATRVRQGADGARHVLRLAYLLVAGVLPARAARDDPSAIEAAYDEACRARPAPRMTVWWRTIGLGAAIVAAGAALAFAAGILPRSAHRGSTPAKLGVEATPAQRDAFADGGVPMATPGDAVIARALGNDAPDFLIALDRRSRARREQAAARVEAAEAAMRDARSRALAPDARAALGEAPSRALEALLDMALDAADKDDRTPEEFGRRAAAFDDALAAAGLGYFVDADVITEVANGRRFVLVYFFRVARVDVWGTPSQTVRALWLRRLDKLNWSHALLGFTRPTNRNAAVLLDQLEEQILTLLGPALADTASMTLYEPADSGAKDADRVLADREAVEAKAGEIARAELGAVPRIDRLAVAKLGRLLGQRHTLFQRWEALARPRGMTIVEPSQLRLPEGFGKSLGGLVPADDLAEMHRIDEALDDATRAQAFASLRDVLGRSVERHEVQHRLDALGQEPLRMPKALEERVGELMDEDGKERRIAASARAELSAYLAELARDTRTPKLGLTMITRFLFDQRLHGTGESYAALTILEGLAGRFASTAQLSTLLVNHKIDRHAVASAWFALVALPSQRLREEAGKLWQELFGLPLPELHRVAPAEEGPPE